jgi:hypothetical protein
MLALSQTERLAPPWIQAGAWSVGANPIPLPPRPWGGLSYDVSDRRRLVLQLRVGRTTQERTARLLGVSQSTISRDLRHCRQHCIVVGFPANSAEQIGEAVALAEEVRTLALLEHARLVSDPGTNSTAGTRARLDCLAVAVQAQGLLIDVLQAAGLLPPPVSRHGTRRSSSPSHHSRRRRTGLPHVTQPA